VHANDKKFSGEPDAGNLHVGFDEGRVGRTTVLPSLLLYRLLLFGDKAKQPTRAKISHGLIAECYFCAFGPAARMFSGTWNLSKFLAKRAAKSAAALS